MQNHNVKRILSKSQKQFWRSILKEYEFIIVHLFKTTFFCFFGLFVLFFQVKVLEAHKLVYVITIFIGISIESTCKRGEKYTMKLVGLVRRGIIAIFKLVCI
jgi:hypothetical protein